MLSGLHDWDPNPHVSDIQLQAFTYFLKNQLRWNKDVSLVECVESNEHL